MLRELRLRQKSRFLVTKTCILAKCFSFKNMIHVRVCIRCEPKPLSPQSSKSSQSENTETSPSLINLQRLENVFPRLQIP